MKALLVGSSFSAVPMLFTLKEMNAHVTVMGKFESDPCHAYADASVFEDYSDPAALMSVCVTGKFDYIIPTCNDYSYLAASIVAGQLRYPGFDSIETTYTLHTKDKFRKFCQRVGIPSPTVYGEVNPNQSSILDDIVGPVLVKPVDSFSGRGVQLVQSMDDMSVAVDRALAMSRRKRAVIEQFMQGSLHSHTAFVSNGNIIWHDFVDEHCETYPYQVDRSTYPSRLSDHIRQGVHHSMCAVVDSLQLCDGLIHTQFIASEGSFWIIESMRRCPGDLYGHHFRFAIGYDYENQYVAGFVGRSPLAPQTTAATVSVERIVISVERKESFFGVSIPTDSRKSTFVPLKESGQPIEAAPFDKAGIIFFEGDRRTEVNKDSERLQLLGYSLESDESKRI